MKTSLCNIFFILILLTLNQHQVSAQNAPYKVVIVGAGLSGYSAAAKLIENEIDNILVLEAEDYIGGRVRSIPFNNVSDQIIDMGAQWLHGQQGNLIYEMIDGNFDFGDSSFENAENYFWQSDGVPANQIHVSNLTNLADLISSQVYEQDPIYIGTFGSFFTANYLRELRTPDYNAIPWDTALQVLNLYHSNVNKYYASKSWFDISIAVYATQSYTLGNQYVTWRDEGFKTVFDFISKRRPNVTDDLDVESKIELNKEVVHIRWDDDVATLSCSDGTEYNAEYVIFTASLGVLKDRHESIFNPRLPDRKVSAIENIEYGSLEKIFLEFETPFWDTTDNFKQYSILWTQNDIHQLVGTDQEWLLDIAYFRRVDAFPNILGTFFIGARIPNYEDLTEDKVIDDCMFLIRRMLNQQVPRALRALRSEWITKRNFLGSYAVYTMNSAHHGAYPSVLAEPVYNANGRPRIVFAGEATSSAFVGYSNGAVETGFRAGEEVLEYISSSERLSKNIILLVILLLPALLKL